MTESEWLQSDDPAAMLRWLTARDTLTDASDPRAGKMVASDRKLRLFACAVWRHMRAANLAFLGFDGPDFRYVEAAEDLADGVPLPERFIGDPWLCFYDRSEESAQRAVKVYPEHAAAQAAILRDIVGNPWRPVTQVQYVTGRHDHIWDMASCAYAERREDGTLDPDRLAVLSDALEESGCADPDILMHLRGKERCARCGGKGTVYTGFHDVTGPTRWCDDMQGARPGPACRNTGWCDLRGPHARGCHVLDLILGKT